MKPPILRFLTGLLSSPWRLATELPPARTRQRSDYPSRSAATKPPRRSPVPRAVRVLLLAEGIDYEELRVAALDTGIDERLRDPASRFADSDPKAAQAFASCGLTRP